MSEEERKQLIAEIRSQCPENMQKAVEGLLAGYSDDDIKNLHTAMKEDKERFQLPLGNGDIVTVVNRGETTGVSFETSEGSLQASQGKERSSFTVTEKEEDGEKVLFSMQKNGGQVRVSGYGDDVSYDIESSRSRTHMKITGIGDEEEPPTLIADVNATVRENGTVAVQCRSDDPDRGKTEVAYKVKSNGNFSAKLKTTGRDEETGERFVTDNVEVKGKVGENGIELKSAKGVLDGEPIKPEDVLDTEVTKSTKTLSPSTIAMLNKREGR